MTNSNILIAFALTLFAGLSTGIGSLIAFFARRTQTKFLSVTLGFSAGVMRFNNSALLWGDVPVHGLQPPLSLEELL